MSRTSKLPKRLQPMLATLTDAPFDDPGWIFEDKFDGFRMVAEIRSSKLALSRRRNSRRHAVRSQPRHGIARRALRR